MFDIIFKESEIGLEYADHIFKSALATLVVESTEIDILENGGNFNESSDIENLYTESGSKFIAGIEKFFKRIYTEIKNFFTKITNSVGIKLTELRIDHNIEVLSSMISKIEKDKLNDSVNVCDTAKYSMAIKSLINSGYGGLNKITKEYNSPEIAEEEYESFMRTLDDIDDDIDEIIKDDKKQMKFSNALNMIKTDKKNVLNLLKEYNSNLSKAIKEAEKKTENEDDLNKIHKLQLFSTKLVSLTLKHVKNLINKIFSNMQKLFSKINTSDKNS